MRTVLNVVYAAALWLAALCLVAIVVLVLAQVGARLLDAVLPMMGQPRTGWQILSLSEIAGFLLAGASFLALGPTFKSGGHIRVTMFLSMFGQAGRRWAEQAAAVLALVIAAYLAWHLTALAHESWRFNELSIGLVPIPLVWPQIPLVIGAWVLVIALADEALAVLREGRFGFQAAEDAVSLGKEG